MPVKRRAGKAHHSSELLPVELAFLRDEPLPDDCSFADDCAWWSMLGMAGGWGGPYEPRDPDGLMAPKRPSISAMWAAVGRTIVEEWRQDAPGSRPRCWWLLTAPEPRRRLGGSGEPDPRLRPRGQPDMRYGVPTCWSAESDPADPPTFESQATYLQRLNLLLPNERERLTEDDFLPEAIRAPRRVHG